jgi:hypothetical protein
MANLNGLAGTILGQTVTRLLGELQIVADQFDQHRTVLEMLKRKEIGIDDYQLIDGGGIQVMPPPAPPKPDACDPTVGDSFGKIKNNRNGKNGTQPETAEALSYG